MIKELVCNQFNQFISLEFFTVKLEMQYQCFKTAMLNEKD